MLLFKENKKLGECSKLALLNQHALFLFTSQLSQQIDRAACDHSN
jgi:hypothetical protein